MQSGRGLLAYLLAAGFTLSGCKETHRSGTDATIQAAATNSAESGIHFNLAAYTRQRPELTVLAAMAAPGDAFLSLGDKNTFYVQANATADGESPKGMPPKFKASAWINGTVFGKSLGTTDKLIEIATETAVNPITVRGIVRYQGQEKLNAPLTKVWSQTFARSLAVDAVLPSPVPGLGVTFGANIGGEFGGAMEPNIRGGNALSLAFIPKISLSAGVTGGVKSTLFAAVDAFGTVTILDTNLTHFASLAYQGSVGIAAGSIGIDDGFMKWLSGRVGIRARVGQDATGGLPTGVDKALWTVASSAGLPSGTWEHTLWAPSAVNVYALPQFSAFMERYINSPGSRSECLSKAKDFSAIVKDIGATIDADVSKLTAAAAKTNDPLLQNKLKAQATTKTNYDQILVVAQAECATL